MATNILDTYNSMIKELRLTNLGKWNTKNGDPTPYSGENKNVEEGAIQKLENEFGTTRYRNGPLGGGSPNSPGYSPEKEWSSTFTKK
jgi:hypothetical protein